LIFICYYVEYYLLSIYIISSPIFKMHDIE